ncbi:sigma-E factor negative regulatory protein [Rhodanobacter lindaniclasticus]
MNQAQTNQDARENLSASMDGELPVEQLRFLLRRLDHDEALRLAWSGYHFARDGLRREISMRASGGFAARVMLAIEQETIAAAAVPSRRHAWLRWSGGGVIAAGVAAAALMISQPAGDATRVDPLLAAGSSQTTMSVPASAQVAPPTVPPWLSGNAAGLLSQQASATRGEPLHGSQLRDAQRLSAYPAMHRYRTLDNNDGSYLLLLDPAPPGTPDAARQAGAGRR